MSPTDCLRLFVLCLWLLDGDVNCENTQEGYVLHVQAEQAAMGVHNDNGDYKRWSEPPIIRIPKAGYKTSSVHRGQRGNNYPTQEDHTTDSKSSQIQSSYLYSVFPETQIGNFPKSRVNDFKSGFNPASVTRRRTPVVYNRSLNKASAFPGGKKIHQANSDSVLSTGAIQVPPTVYHARTKSTGGISPVQVDRAAVGFRPNNRKSLLYSQASPNAQAIKPSLKSESHKIHVNPFGYPKKTGHFTGSNSAGEADTHMSHPAFSPRAYSSDVMTEAKGYTHARRLKPGSDKTKLQASSAAGRKFLDTGFPSAKQNQGSYGHDSTKLGFGFGVPASNHNSNSRGKQPWHPPPPQIPVQGKFKPFQRLPAHDDLPAPTHSSDNETTPTQTSAETTPLPSLNSTTNTSSGVPSVDGELSTKANSSIQTEGQDEELVLQAANSEGQSESSAEVGSSLEQNETFTVSPPELQAAEKDEEDDTVVSSPLETDQSGV